VDNVVWASVVLPDCRSLLRVAIRLEMLEDILLDELLPGGGGGGGGGPCVCIIWPIIDSPAEESICAKRSLELLSVVPEEVVVDEDVVEVVVLDVNSLLSSAINSFISLRVEALELPDIPLIEFDISNSLCMY